MECNKDEATRAKEIAQQKFSGKDIIGAKKFALKAQNLFPGLEGIPQLLASLDVHAAAEKKINGEVDWYGILGVDQQADEETIRKQYRKLALTLHPDKNKSVGADGAFKLVSEAWTLLSHKAKRTAYDKAIHQSSTSVSAPGRNGYNSKKSSSKPHTHSKPPKSSGQHSNHHKQKANTFWTVCHGCKMQYEYLRVYLNHNLLCPNCHEPFMAVETAPPLNGSKTSGQWNFSQKLKNPNKQTSKKKSDSRNKSSFQWTPFTNTGGPPSVAQAASVVQQAYERVRREREEAEAAIKREDALQKKKYSSKRMGASSISQNNVAKKRKGVHDDTANEIGAKVDGASKDLSPLEIQNMLMKKAKKAVLRKLDEWKSVTFPKPEVNRDVEKSEKSNEGEERSQGNRDLEHLAMSIDVPDPDFHDFDKDRTEESFGENQVWAAYDNNDGMPRYYAMIHAVISADPFKIRISWLNSKSNTEFGPLNWVSSGFTKTSGDFNLGRYETNNSLNSFSHRVRWSKGLRGLIHIYPRKGEIWALYRNWSPDWDELTPSEVIYKYDMVEVLKDFTEKAGVTVTPLVKVAGFRAVFHRHLDDREIRTIPRDEMFRFSHHVPSYVLTGQEASNALKGCRELDPAATPSELLQVIIPSVTVEEAITIDKKAEEYNAEEMTKKGGEAAGDVVKVIDVEIWSKLSEDGK